MGRKEAQRNISDTEATLSFSESSDDSLSHRSVLRMRQLIRLLEWKSDDKQIQTH